MKKLPIGLQSIEKLLGEGCVYVDKTLLVYKLITEAENYFLSRPRRFGKSLLVSTLKAIFSGEKELFKNCQIYSTDYRWQKHPIIHLDFAQIPNDGVEKLELALQETLEYIAESYNISIKGSSLQMQLGNLIRKLSKQTKVVVLVDEYDKPLIDNLERMDVAEANRDLLKNFFGTVKSLDSHLKFVFVTGVSKFSQVSLFSGFNNLKDITIHPDYATLLGYTEEEIYQFFSDHLKRLAKQKSLEGSPVSESQIVQEMREWYNGYRFSWGQSTVYNPHSSLCFLDSGRKQSYWFQTGTPSFLIEQVKKLPQSVVPMSGVLATENELLDIRSPRAMSLKALMWQTGYLTIQTYDLDNSLYQLDFPNKEVRQAFFGSLIEEFAKLEPSSVSFISLECHFYLDKQDLKAFFKIINIFFAKIPYSLFNQGDEGTYQAIFLSLLEVMEIRTRAEEQTNLGRIDLVVEMKKVIYIFEFKIDKNAEEALQQIGEKKYKEKYLNHNKEIATIGINFSSKKRTISDWKAIVYSADGAEKVKLGSE